MGVKNNLSPKQRAEVQRQIARAYRAWRKRYGEPTPKEREAIVAIGFKEARKSMRSIPTAANPSLVASAIGGVTGALVANALGNPAHYAHSGAKLWDVVKVGRSKFRAIGRDLRGVMFWKGSGPTIYVLIEKAQGEWGLGRFDDEPFAQPIAQQFSRLSSDIKRHIRAQQRGQANPLVTMPAAPFMEIGPAAAMPLNSNGRGPWVVYSFDSKAVVGGPFASTEAAQEYIERSLSAARIGGGVFPRYSIVRAKSARQEGLAIPGEETTSLHKSKKACVQCGEPLSLMATLDKTRFWWECPSGHTTQLNPQPNPLLMTVLGANPGPLAEARATLAALGMSLTHSAEIGEYRVNYRGGKESTAYYTDDLADAVLTGKAMAGDAASRYGLNPEGGKSHKISRDDIVRAVRSLTHPGTPEEVEVLVREHEGKYYRGYPYEMQSMIVGSLVELRRRGGRWDNPGTLNVGDRVMYAREWLRSTGTYTGELPQKKGVIKEIEDLGGLKIATVLWEGRAIPLWSKVNIANLRRVGSVEHNPYAGGPTVDESPRIARLRDIAASEVDTEFEGVSLDPMSASVLVQVHDALPHASRARFAKLPLPRMGNIAMQAMMKRSANPSLSFEHPEGTSRPEFHSSVTGGARRLSMMTPTPSMQMWPIHPAKGLEVGVHDERTGRWGYHYGSSAIARDVYGLNPGENPRAVHESIVSAFFDRQPRRIGERYSTDGQALRVWGNLVAEWRPEGLYITDAGWRTLLTRNVLNQILVEAFRRGRPSGQIYQKKYDWYFEPITHPEGRRLKAIPWTGGIVVGTSSVAPVMVPAANPGVCPSLCMNPMHEHKPKTRRIPTRKVYRSSARAPLRAAANPGRRRGRKITMSLEEFARKIKATNNPKLWNDFLAKVRGYKKWSHGTIPKRVTVETVDGAPGMKGTLITYDAGRAPESTYIMPGGTKRKGAWKHPWSRMPQIKHDPEAGLVIHRVGGKRVSNFYHG